MLVCSRLEVVCAGCLVHRGVEQTGAGSGQESWRQRGLPDRNGFRALACDYLAALAGATQGKGNGW